MRRTDAANTVGPYYQAMGSAAGTNTSLPIASTTIGSSGNNAASLNVLTYGTDKLTVAQTVAGAQNDTFRVQMLIRVKGALPTVTKARSTNQADVTVTAGAASFTFIA